MSNLIDIQSQIEKLQKQANEIKTKEFARTVQEILAKMNAFGMTLKDLQPRKGGGAKAKSKSKSKPALTAKKTGNKSSGKEKSAAVVPAKYKGPNGDTWSGRGVMKRWLADLVAQGHAKEEYLIKS